MLLGAPLVTSKAESVNQLTMLRLTMREQGRPDEDKTRVCACLIWRLFQFTTKPPPLLFISELKQQSSKYLPSDR
jgi:hypothetical protein